MATKFIIRNKESSGFITYIYKNGFRAKVKPDYGKFLKDVMQYAGASESEIKTQEDLINLFDRAKNKGANFSESIDGKQALVDEWNRQGKDLIIKKDGVNLKTVLKLSDEIKRKIKRKDIKKFRRAIDKSEKGNRLSRDEFKILFNFLG